MLAYLPLIQKILLGYMTKRTHEFGFSLNLQGIILMVLAGIFGFIAFLFLLFGIRTYLETLYGLPLSWLLTSAGVFVIACTLYLFAAYSKRKKGLVNRIKEDVKEDLSPLAQIVETLAEPVKDHPIASVLLAALAGLVAGEKMHGNENGEGT